jgi:hypothetical protein
MDPDGTYLLDAETTGSPTHWAPIPTDGGDHSLVRSWRSRAPLWLLIALAVIAFLFTLIGAELENLFDFLR